MLNTSAQELTWLLHLHFTFNSTLNKKINESKNKQTWGSPTHRDKPEEESALLPVHQQTRQGKCTAVARPCCWCWLPPVSAHQQWFCPPDPAKNAGTSTEIRNRARETLWNNSQQITSNSKQRGEGSPNTVRQTEVSTRSVSFHLCPDHNLKNLLNSFI